MNHRVDVDDPIWRAIEETCMGMQVPTSTRSLCADNLTLIQLAKGQLRWADPRSTRFLELIRDQLSSRQSSVEIDLQDRTLRTRGPRDLIAPEADDPGINYVGAVSFAVYRHAETEFAEVIAALRRPIRASVTGHTLIVLREKRMISKGGPDQAEEYAKKRDCELSSNSIFPVNTDEAIQHLNWIANDSPNFDPATLEKATLDAASALNRMMASNEPGAPYLARCAWKVKWGEKAQPNKLHCMQFETTERLYNIRITEDCSYLHVLWQIARILADFYSWAPSVAVPFILCGQQAVKKVAKLTFDVREDLPCCSRIVIEVDPAMTVEEVADIYRTALKSIGAEKRKGLSPKHLALSGEACRTQFFEWSELMSKWNAERAKNFGAKGTYDKLPLFKRDCQAALKNLLFPKWKRPDSNSLYPRLNKSPKARNTPNG